MYWGSNEVNNNLPTSFTVANNTLTSAVWLAGPDGLVVDNITRPNENAYTYYINLDGKFKVTDNLTMRSPGRLHARTGQYAQRAALRSRSMAAVPASPTPHPATAGW